MINQPFTPPKYFELAETLRQAVKNGRYPPTQRIPSENSLCQTHNLSRGTVRQAIQLLVSEGLLVTEQGKGTFVAPVLNSSEHFTLSSFDEMVRKQNRTPSTKLLLNETVPAPPQIAERLGVGVETAVFHIKRLRLANSKPVAVETRWLAQSLCPQLTDENLETVSLHWLFVHKYNIPLVRMEHVVELGAVDGETAVLLQTPQAATAFHVDRLTFTHNAAGDKIPAVLYQAVYVQQSYAIQTETL